MWLIIAGLALIIGLIAFFFRRRQLLSEADTSATLTAGDFPGQLRAPLRSHQAMDADDGVDTDEHQALDLTAARAVAFGTAQPAAQLSEDTLSGDTAIHVDQQDALAEADFHMAYGLYDQAADMVKSPLSANLIAAT